MLISSTSLFAEQSSVYWGYIKQRYNYPSRRNSLCAPSIDAYVDGGFYSLRTTKNWNRWFIVPILRQLVFSYPYIVSDIIVWWVDLY
jgi:hypothetical protein